MKCRHMSKLDMTGWRSNFEHAGNRFADQLAGLARPDDRKLAQPSGKQVGDHQDGTDLDRYFSGRNARDGADHFVALRIYFT